MARVKAALVKFTIGLSGGRRHKAENTQTIENCGLKVRKVWKPFESLVEHRPQKRSKGVFLEHRYRAPPLTWRRPY